MATKLNRAQKVFNLIRVWGSKEYQDIVPKLTDKSPIGDVRSPILEQPVVFKEFTTLLGRLLKIECDARVWNNSFLDLFIQKGTPFGEITGDVANNPVEPRSYDPTHPENLLKNAFTDDFVAYYVRNIKEVFEVTISYEDIKGALAGYDEFDAYVEMKLASLINGKRKSMFNHAMESIVVNFKAGMFVESPAHIGKNDNAGKTRAWATDVMTKVDNFAFYSTDYNKYGSLTGAQGSFETYCDPEDVVLIARADVLNNRKVSELAIAFNLSQAEINAMIVKVPEFAYTYKDENGVTKKVTTNIQAILCDKKILKYKNDLEIADSFYNIDTLCTKYYEHFWASFNVSPLGNAVVYTDNKSESTDFTAISITDYGQHDGERFIDVDPVTHKQILTIVPVEMIQINTADISFEFVNNLTSNGTIQNTEALTQKLTHELTGTDADGEFKLTVEQPSYGTAKQETIVANLVCNVDGNIAKTPVIIEIRYDS